MLYIIYLKMKWYKEISVLIDIIYECMYFITISKHSVIWNSIAAANHLKVTKFLKRIIVKFMFLYNIIWEERLNLGESFNYHLVLLVLVLLILQIYL